MVQIPPRSKYSGKMKYAVRYTAAHLWWMQCGEIIPILCIGHELKKKVDFKGSKRIVISG